MAEPIGWIERYALAADRASMLAELIPGSDDYYFYHCLYYQTSGQLERSEVMLRDWLAEHKGNEIPSITAMIDRQRLLTYRESPERTIDHLVRRLGINLDHPAPPTQNERRFPSSFDQGLLDVERLVQDAIQRNDQLKPLGMRYLAAKFRQQDTAGIAISLYDFLARVDGAYLEGLDELVSQELASRNPNDKRFGDLAAHQFLTLDELRSVAKSVPEIAADNEFVSAVLRRLRPDADSDPSQQPQVRVDYLTRVEAYLRTLPPSYNSMKASATFRLLEANLLSGVFDRDLFLRYLQLPRVSPIVHKDWLSRGVEHANLGQDFMDRALLPPVGDEQPLVRAHLEHFLRDADNTDAFAQFLQPDYLRQVFAETKLLGGIGDDQQWYKLLSTSQRQAIRDSVELRLSAENPKRFPTDQVTGLAVDVKNIDELVVRIYEINTLSYYRTHDTNVDTDIDLDGLVATHEKKLTFNQPAVQRHREVLQLPEITGRGVWIVDLVGKGVRARALVRRGFIDHVATSNANGMAFTIIDENRQPIPAATMLVGSREFIADDDGRIVLPPMDSSVFRRAVISDGVIAQQVTFNHLVEQYELLAGMHVDRTQLQSGSEAELIIRPRLSLNGTLIDPNTLKKVVVRIDATDLEGLSITHQVTDLEIDQSGELVVPIRVPARLSELTVTLTGTVVRLADGRETSLETSRNWDVAGIRRTAHTHDSFLTRDGDDYVIEVRGRNGEPIPRATVVLALTTEFRNAPVESTLQSDEQGQIRLGKLVGVASLRYSVPNGLSHHRDLNLDQVRWADEIYTTVDRSIQLPLADQIEDVNTRYRLLEVRGGGYHADVTKQLSIAEGLLKITGLAAGDYLLIDQSTNRQTSIAVVEGPAIDAVATGQIRHREISPAIPLGIASIRNNADGLQIKLSGKTDSARVHLYASRYLDRATPLQQLDLPLPRLSGRGVSMPISGYVSDLRLGDQYQYVLRRRYAQKFPGVMLPQPSILLNPWETEETSNTSQAVDPGDVPPPSAAAPSEAAAADAKRAGDVQAESIESDYDFLADPGIVIANLRPDENGVVTIAADLVAGMPILQVIACDAATMLQRTVTAPLEAAETIDLRLAKALAAETPFTFERGVLIASAKEPLDLQSLGSAQLQVYSSVADLLKIFKTLVNDPRLSDFDELASWHKLDVTAKRDAYTRLASHELHLFLWFHDPSYFNDEIKPYLQNKQEKQFVDHWLLGDDLTPYTKLWRYNQLNAAERALLAMRLPLAREAIQRELKEIVETQDENYAEVRQGIESALRTSGMLFDQPNSGIVDYATLDDEAVPMGSGMGGAALGEELRRSDRRKKLQENQTELFLGRGADKFFKGRHLGLQTSAFYQNLDSTKQWAESHWDRVRTVGGPPPASLISVNPFWLDLARGDVNSPAISTNLLRPIENRHAALVALAMCGLPLAAGDVGLPTEPGQPYAPAHAVAVVTKRLKKLEPSKEQSAVLIGQRFTPVDDTNQQRKPSEPAVDPTEFLIGTAYRGQVVVSNPTAEQRVVDVFWQLPAGSLPLTGSQSTDSKTMVLEPFAVQAIAYEFYFPTAGTFSHYPATVAAEDVLLAQAGEKSFTVVSQPTEQNTVTWEKVAVSGSPDQIKAFLLGANLRELNWLLVAHRMRDQEVYRVIIEALGQAQLPISELWAYSFVHRDEPAMQGFLSMQAELVDRVGPALDSELLTVEPIERRTHELLEYAPLVNARVHRLGEVDEIMNPTFLVQYQGFLRVLSFSKQIAAEQKLVLAYYQLIQNRIAESIETFTTIDRNNIDSKLQYDYLSAYLAMHREQYEAAEKTAKQYADHPIPRWNSRFQELLSQLNQRRDLHEVEKLVSVDDKDEAKPIAEGSGDLSVLDREHRQARASAEQPEVIVHVEGDSLRIDHRRAQEVMLNFYGVDLELLFSKAPFVREDLQRMAMVRPARTQQIKFDSLTGLGRFDLDDNLRRQTLLVEVVAGASRSTALYYGGDITTYVSESFGQLQTTDAATHQPISAAYVKVYAKYPDGSVRFYKDGYTDSRGRFDYTSVSAGDAKGASRYAILVMSDEKGATLHDVSAPNQ